MDSSSSPIFSRDHLANSTNNASTQDRSSEWWERSQASSSGSKWWEKADSDGSGRPHFTQSATGQDSISSNSSRSKSGKQNPFAAPDTSKFNMFLVSKDTGGGNPWSSQKKEGEQKWIVHGRSSRMDDKEEDDSVTSCRRRMKRLKSLDLPVELTKELLATLNKPNTNTQMFGVHDLPDRALFNFGVCASQGSRIHMEDRYCVVGRLLNEPYSSFYAVFDGHGGSSVAEHCANHLHRNFQANIERYGSTEIVKSFMEAFLQTDEQVRKSPGQGVLGQDLSLVGSTAVAVLLSRTECIIANVGDSRALLVQEHTSEATQLTHDHKPNIETEKQRIEAAGGRISDDRVEGILAMSRAIGDAALKQYVIATPQITLRTLSPQDQFLILGTDGLYDFVNNTNASSIVKCATSLQGAAEALVAGAMNARSNDNVTAMVIDLRTQKNESSLLEDAGEDEHRGGANSTHSFAPASPPELNFAPTLVKRSSGKRPSLSLEISDAPVFQHHH